MYCFSRIVFLLTGLLIVSSNTVHAQTKTRGNTTTASLVRRKISACEFVLYRDGQHFRQCVPKVCYVLYMRTQNEVC